jgi:hypothetical protein
LALDLQFAGDDHDEPVKKRLLPFVERPQSHHLDVLTVKGDAAVSALADLLDQAFIVLPGDVDDDDALVGRNAVEQVRWRWLQDLGNGHRQGSLITVTRAQDRPPVMMGASRGANPPGS